MCGSHFLPEEADSPPDTSGPIVYRFGAPLYLVNDSLFEEEVEKLVTQGTTPVKWLVLDVEAMVDIDTSGAEVLHQVLPGHRGHISVLPEGWFGSGACSKSRDVKTQEYK